VGQAASQRNLHPANLGTAWSLVAAKPDPVIIFDEVHAMSLTEEQIAEAALSLSPQARAELADRLLISLGGPEQAEIDRAWAEECERRIDDYDAGRVKGIPAEEVLRPRTSQTKP
jgi:putative addiction module component (TIGR02574 family)